MSTPPAATRPPDHGIDDLRRVFQILAAHLARFRRPVAISAEERAVLDEMPALVAGNDDCGSSTSRRLAAPGA
jgi:hypothetical protein